MTYLSSLLILHVTMQFLLYSMLALNLTLGAVSYIHGDQKGISHATTFGLVACVGLGLAWLSRRES